MIKGIIFDFGGVFTYTRPRERLLHRCEAQLGLEQGALTFLLFASEPWRAVSTGKTSEEEYWQEIESALGGPIPAALAPFKYNPFAYERLNQRMVALTRQLHTRYGTALLSNATAYLDELLAEHGLTLLFDVIINSAQVGMRKPDPQILRLTVNRMGLRPGDCLLVDDKERNTRAAQVLGMQVILFRSAAALQRRITALESESTLR